jgi:hypothetical protein
MRPIRPLLLPACVLLVLPVQAPAQAPSTPAPARVAVPAAGGAATAGQQAALQRQDAEMTRAALKAAQMIDGGQVAALWDGASPVVRKAVTREAFLAAVQQARAQVGALVGRGQASVSRTRFGPGAQVPEGLYVNVSFATRFANAPRPVRELVSFRLDEDKVWRLSGYNLRVPPRS